MYKTLNQDVKKCNELIISIQSIDGNKYGRETRLSRLSSATNL